jgi:hypothetical protein
MKAEKSNKKMKTKTDLVNDRLANIGTIINHHSTEAENTRKAAECLRQGQSEINQIAQQYGKCNIEQTSGRAAEIWHKSTFEADASLKNRRNLNVLVGPKGGVKAKGSADLIVNKNGIEKVAAGIKYRKKATETVFDQANMLDEGRQKICPSEQVDKIKHIAGKRAKTSTLKAAEYADTAKQATDTLSYGKVHSRPLTKKAAVDLVKNPNRLASEAVALEIKQAAMGGAKTGFKTGCLISSVKNINSCLKGDKELSKAVVDITGDTIKTGVESAVIGVGGTVVKEGLKKVGANVLTKGSIPLTIASSALEAGSNIVSDLSDYFDGDIEGSELAGRAVVHTSKAAAKGTGAWAGAEIGGTLGTFLGPVGTISGTVIGGTLGYIFSSSLFD